MISKILQKGLYHSYCKKAAMKTLIICSFLFINLALYVNSDFETDLKYIKLCNRTSPISLRTMNEVLINKKLTGSSRSSSNFECFLHCLFNQYGWMDEDGGFEIHKIKLILEETGNLNDPLLEYIMYTCTAIKSTHKCERAFEFTKCFWKKAREEITEEERFFYTLEENRKK